MVAEAGRLEQVVGHWMARMLTAGITYTDAARLVAEAGDWARWCSTWSAEAKRHLAQAEASEAQGRPLTAGEAYVRAALCYHFAQFMFFDDLAQKGRAAEHKVAVYAKAAPLLSPPARPVAVPFAGGTLHGYLRAPAGEAGSLVIVVAGSDSTKEEFGSLEEHFLRRGLATFSFDGPGQGEGRDHGPLTPDWGPVLQAVLAALSGREGVRGPFGCMGMAFGGHLVLQGAAAVPELRALACMNGFFDMGAFWDELPPVYRANMGYALGGESPEDTRERARRFTLQGARVPACRTLVIHGGRDRIFPVADARRIVEHLGEGAEWVEYADGNHVCNNRSYLYRPLLADWMAERLRR